MRIEPTDPLREHRASVFSASFHVLGARFRVESNAAALLEIVAEAFAELPQYRLDSEPLELRVELVLDEQSPETYPAELPPLQFQGGHDYIVGAYDAANYLVVSPRLQSAFVRVTSGVLSRRREVRYELIESAFLLLAPRVQQLVPLHAACLGLNGKGLLLSGDSGAGKSLLCLNATQLGLDFLAEDGVFIDSRSLLAVGCPQFVHLREDALTWVADERTRNLIADSPTVLRRDNERKFEVNARKLTGNIKRSNTLVIFINQIRMKIGVMFGNPETTTGGNALKFYSSVRLDIRRIGAIKKADEVLGNQTRVKIVKNKVAPPFKQCEFDILYNEGISHEGELIDIGVMHNIVDKSGAWYGYGKERIGQGKDNARQYLKDHPEMASEIEEKLRVAMGISDAPEITDAPDMAEEVAGAE